MTKTLFAILVLVLRSSSVQAVVVTYHPLATQAGESILKAKGNAFDAFVASTWVQYVLSEGVTSPAGPLHAMIYHAKSKEVVFLDGWLNNVKDPDGLWDAASPVPGKAFVIPGAVKALEELSKKYGKLSFSECIRPAYEIARDGFPLNSLYAALIKSFKDVLLKSEYGKQTFFKDGKPLREGEILKLPEVATFLSGLMKEGSDYMYRGNWAKKTVALIQSQGGKLTLDDLANYKTQWLIPLRYSYRGYDIYSPSGLNAGGLYTALTLKTFENWSPNLTQHYSNSAPDLETLVRVTHAVDEEEWLYQPENILDSKFVQSRLSSESIQKIWKRVQDSKTNARIHSGSHSYQVVVMDAEGNAITGMHTIEGYPWGDGNFVEGIPLNNAGSLKFSFFRGQPGQRKPTDTAMDLVFQQGQLKFATGGFSASTLLADIQFLINLIDYKASAKDAVNFPRFGNRLHRQEGQPEKNSISPRVNTDVIQALEKNGVYFEVATFKNGLDTGLGSVAVQRPDGTQEGDFAPLSKW